MKSFAYILAITFFGMNQANALCGFGWISSTPPTPTCSCPSNKLAIKRMANSICQEEKCVSSGVLSHYLNQGWIYGCCAVARLDGNNSFEISLYPKPVTNMLNVTGAFEEHDKIEIRDAIGRIVHSSYLNPQFTIDVSGWEQGIYFATVTTAQNIFVEKIVVK